VQRLVLSILLIIWSLSAQTYYPGKHDDWQRKSPAEAGFDVARLNEAIEFAKAHESKSPRDLRLSHEFSFAREPHGEPLGPFKQRGDLTGIILHKGYLVAEWGEPWRVDMTFSATKSFVSTAVGLAVQDGLIKAIHDPVGR
jgi:hypothetical protein